MSEHEDDCDNYTNFDFDLLAADDDPDFVTTNEFDNLLDNIKALDVMIGQAIEIPHLWKWVIIVAHTTLANLAVCKLTHTDGSGALRNQTEKKFDDFYERNLDTLNNAAEFSALFSDDRVEGFKSLMKRMGYTLNDNAEPCVDDDATLDALNQLDKLRNFYIHVRPIGLTVSISDVKHIVQVAVKIITSEIHAGSWHHYPSFSTHDVMPPLDSIKHRLASVTNN